VVVCLLAPLVLRDNPASADPVTDKKAQAARLASQLDAMNRRSSQLAEAYDQARLNLDEVNRKLAAAKTALGSTDQQMTGAQNRVKSMAVESYMQGGAAHQLSLLLPSSATEIGVRGTYVRSATANTNDAVDALHQAHVTIGRLQAQLAASQKDASRAVGQLQAAQTAASGADAAVQAAYARAQGQLGQAELAQAQQARVAAEQARVAAQLAAGRDLTPPSARVARATPAGGAVTIGTTRGGSSPPRGGSTPPAGSGGNPLPPPGVGASAAISFARAELGVPYVYGGAGPGSFDCSGLTAWAWGHAGHPLPHSSEAQYYDTTHVSVGELQPGDLVFYGMPPHHVGIYVGGGMMINALHAGTSVEYDSIYMEGDLIGGGRVN